MKKIIALIAAVGFAVALSSPTLASTIDLSAAKKKVDCTMEKNKSNKACKGMMDKKSELTTDQLSAAKKKVDCTMEKNKMNKACKAMMDKKSEMTSDQLSAKKKMKKKKAKKAKKMKKM